jgi:hypothetical protein
MLTDTDIKVGRVFSAKRPQQAGIFDRRLNDRQVLHVSVLDRTLQYDSPTVRTGRHYPRVSFDAFLRWAKADVTDQCPKDEWRTAP